MEAFEVFEHAGFVCELHQDETPGSPAEWDNLGELVSFSPLWDDYGFGRDGQTPGRESTGQEDDAYERGGWKLLERYLLTGCGYVAAVPFEFHDYGSSGTRLDEASVGGGSERVAGFIATTADRVEELGAPREDVGRQLRGELKDWGAFVAGEVCGFVVRDPVSGAVVDSVWGSYPDGEGDGLGELRADARLAAEGERDDRARRLRETVQGWGFAHGIREEVAV